MSLSLISDPRTRPSRVSVPCTVPAPSPSLSSLHIPPTPVIVTTTRNAFRCLLQPLCARRPVPLSSSYSAPLTRFGGDNKLANYITHFRFCSPSLDLVSLPLRIPTACLIALFCHYPDLTIPLSVCCVGRCDSPRFFYPSMVYGPGYFSFHNTSGFTSKSFWVASFEGEPIHVRPAIRTSLFTPTFAGAYHQPPPHICASSRRDPPPGEERSSLGTPLARVHGGSTIKL